MNAEQPDHERNVYILAGPNGAGKTTFATKFLPDFVRCREFLNADLIASGLSPFAPETQNLRAGRLLLGRIRELVAAGKGFGFETTLSGRTYVRLLKSIKEEGYRVVLIYLWLPEADLAVERVGVRVRQGGHNVPEADIRRRYKSGLDNLFRLYLPLADEWWLYDASRPTPTIIAKNTKGDQEVLQIEVFNCIVRAVKGTS